MLHVFFLKCMGGAILAYYYVSINSGLRVWSTYNQGSYTFFKTKLFQGCSRPQQVFQGPANTRPSFEKTNLLLLCTLINADKHYQVKLICHVVIFQAFPVLLTKSKNFPDLEIKTIKFKHIQGIQGLVRTL